MYQSAREWPSAVVLLCATAGALIFSRARVLRYPADLFAAPNWLAVLLGQEVWPENGDPLVSRHDPERLGAELAQIRATIGRMAESSISHDEYLARHARSPA